MYPNFCVSSTNEDLVQSKHPAGDMDINACKYECIVHSKCSAFEWYKNSNSLKCYLILTSTPAVNGSSISDPVSDPDVPINDPISDPAVPSNLPQQTNSQDASCHIKPTTGTTIAGNILQNLKRFISN